MTVQLIKLDNGLVVPRVIVLVGRRHSGKSTTALALKEAFGHTEYDNDLTSLASKLVPGIPVEAFSDDRREQELWCSTEKDPLLISPDIVTPLDLLRRLRQGAREVFGRNFWVNGIVRRMDLELSQPRVATNVHHASEVKILRATGALVIRLNRADQTDSHDFQLVDTAGAGSEGKCGYLYYGHGFPVRCDLAPASHPTSWTSDRHSSETELPDSDPNGPSLYHAVVVQHSAEETARAVTALVRHYASLINAT